MKVNLSRILTVIFSATMVFLLCDDATAQETRPRLRYGFASGQKLTVKQEETTEDLDENLAEGSKSESSTIKEIAQQWEVLNITPAGDATIDVKYTGLRFKRSLAPGISIVLDTGRTIAESNPIFSRLGPQGAPLLERFEMVRKVMTDVFIARTFKIVVSDAGTVKSVSGFEQAWEDYRSKVSVLITDKAKRAELDALIEAFFGEDAVHKMFSYTLFVSLPSQTTGVGQEWSDSTEFNLQSIRLGVTRTYRLASVSDSGKALTIEGKMIFAPPTSTEEVEFKVSKNTLTSEISLAPSAGTLLKQSYTGKIEFEAYGRQPPNDRLIIRSLSDIKGSVLIAIVPK